MDEYTTYSYKSRNPFFKEKKRKKKLKPIYKKIKQDKLYQLVKNHILELKRKGKSSVFAEKVAEKFQVKKHEIKNIFKKLNQEGLLSQSSNYPPHDCRRSISAWDHGGDNSWLASVYYIRKE